MSTETAAPAAAAKAVTMSPWARVMLIFFATILISAGFSTCSGNVTEGTTKLKAAESANTYAISMATRIALTGLIIAAAGIVVAAIVKS